MCSPLYVILAIMTANVVISVCHLLIWNTSSASLVWSGIQNQSCSSKSVNVIHYVLMSDTTALSSEEEVSEHVSKIRWHKVHTWIIVCEMKQAHVLVSCSCIVNIVTAYLCCAFACLLILRMKVQQQWTVCCTIAWSWCVWLCQAARCSSWHTRVPFAAFL